MAKRKPVFKRTTNCPTCPEHNAWVGMWQRCNNKNNDRYHDYGGRGISVSDRWRDFFAFMEDMGRRPPGTSLDRRNNDGNYEPGNCRWATPDEQVNNRRNTHWIVMDGRRKTISQWCRELKIHKNTLKRRFATTGDWRKAAKEAGRNLTQESLIYVEIKGVRKTAREWCKQYKIRFQKAWSRVNRDGWTWQKAITEPNVPVKERAMPWPKVTIDGKTMSMRDWCLHFGVPKGTMWKRMKRGMTFEEALKAPKRINQHK